MRTCMHRSFVAIQNLTSRLQARVRIGGRDSSGKFVLARVGETPAL